MVPCEDGRSVVEVMLVFKLDEQGFPCSKPCRALHHSIVHNLQRSVCNA